MQQKRLVRNSKYIQNVQQKRFKTALDLVYRDKKLSANDDFFLFLNVLLLLFPPSPEATARD